MEKILKRAILIVSIIIVIVLIGIVLINLKEDYIQEQEIEQELELIEKVKIGDIEVENSTHRYLYWNDIINEMFDYISEKEKRVKNSEALISLLDDNYKKENNITEENVLNVLKEYKDITSYFTKEIYKKEIFQRQSVNGQYLYIKGITRKINEEKNIYLLVKEDFINNTYNISIINEEEYNNKGKENQEINIIANMYNVAKTKSFSTYQICFNFLKDYLNTIKVDPSNGYNLLDKEYRLKRFGNKEKYLEYINSIKDRFSDTILKQYFIEQEEEYTRYICVDQIGNYYIFTNKTMMNYTVILDSYTMSLPEFTEKYNESTTMERVGHNIQKCIEAINNKDYAYVYNKLDEDFKTNNYQTEESFIEKIKTNLFDINIIDAYSNLNEGNTYIHKLTIVDYNNESTKKNMTIIMQLKDNEDFVMSFSFQT